MTLLDLGQVFSGDFYCLNDARIYDTFDLADTIDELSDVFIDKLDTYRQLLAVGFARSSFDYFKNSVTSSKQINSSLKLPDTYNELTKELKDKMFNIALHYQSEWSEDSDPEVRSWAEDDTRAIAEMLYENADSDTRNDWFSNVIL